jgi:hypothetical protein
MADGQEKVHTTRALKEKYFGKKKESGSGAKSPTGTSGDSFH